MDLVGRLVSRCTWNLYLRRDGYDVAAHGERLAQTQYLSADELRSLQLTRLRRLLAFAHHHNPFYRRRFDACGFDPGAIATLEDVSQLPILTKDQVRDGLTAAFSDGFRPDGCIRKRTGGSTGVPLHIHVDMRAASEKRAAAQRHDAWAGRRPGQRIGLVWGDTTNRSWKLKLRNFLTDRAICLDTLHFDRGAIDRFLTELERLRPPVIVGHAHSLFRLAERMLSEDRRPGGTTAVISTAMMLSDEERATIERAFGCRVFNRYGCEELSIVASECEAHDGMHIFSEGLLVELLGDDAERVPAKLVITDLTNHAMPLIRYEIGDFARAARGPCACGRTLPRLSEVSGRTADFLYRTDGTPVFGISILDTFVIHIPGIKQAQIVQDRYNHLDFYVVKDAGYCEASRTTLDERVGEIFGEDVRFDLTFVDEIPQTELGKYRFSICKIPPRELERGPASLSGNG